MELFQINKNLLKIRKNTAELDQNRNKAQSQVSGKLLVAAEVTVPNEITMWNEGNKEKITNFIDIVNEKYGGLVTPEITYSEGAFRYNALKEIDEPPINYEFLEKLTHKGSNRLEKFIFNQFLVCPDHQKSFLVNVRLYCTKCNSIRIEKLHLLEHKSCGYLGEKHIFSTVEQDKLKCPSCGKFIKNSTKELRVPATWYHCLDCKEKFDDALIRLHCQEFNHDFNVNEGHAVTIYGYNVINSDKSEFDHAKLKIELAKLVTKFGFSTDEDHVLKGRSGHEHTIDIYGVDKKNQTIVILVNDLDGNGLDSRIIQVIDTAPKIAILVGHSSISEKIKSIASKYNVSIISSQNIDEIVSEAEKIIEFRLKKLEGASNT